MRRFNQPSRVFVASTIVALLLTRCDYHWSHSCCRSMLKKHFTCFIRWVLRWIGLQKLWSLAGEPLSRPLRSALHWIGSLFPLLLVSMMLKPWIASRFGLVNNSCGLITLPQEILEIILAELDWKDVLNARAVSTSVAELPSFSDLPCRRASYCVRRLGRDRCGFTSTNGCPTASTPL